MWFPRACQSGGIEEKNLVAGLPILVPNPKIIVVFPFQQGGIDTRKIFQKNHLLDPAIWELEAAVEADSTRLVLFRKAIQLPLVFDQERVREVMGGLENGL